MRCRFSSQPVCQHEARLAMSARLWELGQLSRGPPQVDIITRPIKRGQRARAWAKQQGRLLPHSPQSQNPAAE